MAKTKNKPSQKIETVKTEPVATLTPLDKKKAMLKPVATLTIEIIKKVAGMEIGTQKTIPARLANQMVALGNAKLI